MLAAARGGARAGRRLRPTPLSDALLSAPHKRADLVCSQGNNERLPTQLTQRALVDYDGRKGPYEHQKGFLQARARCLLTSTISPRAASTPPDDKRRAWPKGLLQPALGMAKVPPDIASELLYEVGWNARHRYVDVRQIQSGGAVRGAIHTPLLPEPHTFLARAEAALHVSERSALGGSNEELTESRIIVGCEGEEAEDARTAITMLQAAGYVRT